MYFFVFALSVSVFCYVLTNIHINVSRNALKPHFALFEDVLHMVLLEGEREIVRP